MRKWIGAAALALAACGGGDKDTGGGDAGGNAGAEASGGNGAAAAGGAAAGGPAAAMRAGQWEISTEVTGVEAPGVPAGAGAAPATTSRICLTPQQVGQPDAGIGTGALTNTTGCVAGSGSAPAPGRIQANVQCEMPGGGRVQVTTEGSSSADRFTASQTTVVSVQGTTMTTRARVTGTRVGDCPG